MNEEQFEANLDTYIEMQKMIGDLANLYIDNFGCGRDNITEIRFGYDATTGDTNTNVIEVATEHYHCSCCGPEYDTHYIPIYYLWDQDWLKREEESRAAAKKRKEQEKKEEERKRVELMKNARKAQYEKLKEEFGNAS